MLTDLSGKVFGRLTVLNRDVNRKSKDTYWNVVCTCGTRKSVRGSHMTNGKIVSCNCYQAEKARDVNTSHGLRYHRLYHTYHNMINRCYKNTNNRFKHYGGKNIEVCERWLGKNGLTNFINDMGSQYAEGLTLDRKENSLGYYFENCRFIPNTEQQNNKSNNLIVTYKGITGTLTQICKVYKVEYVIVRSRWRILNWSLNDAIETPKGCKPTKLEAMHYGN